MNTLQSFPLSPQQVAEALKSTALMLQLSFDALPEEVLHWHFDPKEWCINQALGHLIQTEEAGFSKRIRTMLAEDDPQLISLDQDEEALQRKDCERNSRELLDEFVSLRNASYELVKELRSSDVQRGAWHPDVGYIVVNDLLHEWIYHDQDHFRQIMDNIQRFVWDYLGKTQQFYKPL
jgi:hypothetical protein